LSRFAGITATDRQTDRHLNSSYYSSLLTRC